MGIRLIYSELTPVLLHVAENETNQTDSRDGAGSLLHIASMSSEIWDIGMVT